ncbi:MAG: hypothetical protein LAO21_01005 [Acidobacteriia bacterium]|nr:hypothetical protein [Terriglobia bacterium]
MNKLPNDLDAFEAEGIKESGDFLESLRRQRSACPPVPMLRAAHAGVLTEELQSAVTAHIGSCRLCRVLQADFSALDSTEASPQEVEQILVRVRHQAGKSDGSSFWRFNNFSWRTAFAAVALALGVVLLVWEFKAPQQPGPVSSPVAEVKPAPPPQTPEAFRLEKPAVKMTLGALTWRSNKNGRNQFLKDISPALEAYRNNNFNASADSLQRLSAKYNKSVEVFFYLGVSRLFLAEYPAAIKALEQAARLADDSFSSDVLWYLSISCQRSGQTERARGYLQQLCGGSSGYAARACAALKELKSSANAPLR